MSATPSSMRRTVLAALRPLELATLRVPEAIALVEWEDMSILLLAPFRMQRRADRDLGQAELAGLVELSGLGSALSGVLGNGAGSRPCPRGFRAVELRAPA